MAGYFCQVRFLRRLCLLIFALRRFFNDPILDVRDYVTNTPAKAKHILAGGSYSKDEG